MVVRNVAQYKKKDYPTIIEYIRYQMPALKRSDLMLKSELAFHKWCYMHKLWTEHTVDCDITLKLTFKEKITYATVGLLTLAFSK